MNDRREFRSRPDEQRIERVMREFGFDRLVAVRHVAQIDKLQEAISRRPKTAAEILGKSALDF
jgi:hypothetical protein